MPSPNIRMGMFARSTLIPHSIRHFNQFNKTIRHINWKEELKLYLLGTSTEKTPRNLPETSRIKEYSNITGYRKLKKQMHFHVLTTTMWTLTWKTQYHLQSLLKCLCTSPITFLFILDFVCPALQQGKLCENRGSSLLCSSTMSGTLESINTYF